MGLKKHWIKILQNGSLPFLLLFFPLDVSGQSQSIIEVGKFSTEKIESKIPSHWKPLTFKKIERHTAYSLEKDGGTVVVKAVSKSSASGLV